MEGALPMITWYAVFCPAGADCGKHGKRLGSYPNELAARKAVYNHLSASTKHMWTHELATDAADSAELTAEQWPAGDQQHGGADRAEEMAPRPKRAGSSAGGPYQRPPPPPPQAPQQQMELAVQQIDFMQYAGVMLAAAQKAETAARASARMARQAAGAFDEEAEKFMSAARAFRQILERV